MANMKFLQASKEIQKLIEHSKLKFANRASALEDWLLAEKEIDYLPVYTPTVVSITRSNTIMN